MASATTHSPTTGIDPGLYPVLRVLSLLQVLGTSVVRRTVASAMGLSTPHLPSLMLTLPIPLLLVALVWIPSWEGRRCRVLLPVTLGITSVNLLADKFLMLWWLESPAERELDAFYENK